MSLIKCPECKKEVSDKAEKCPNCGYAIKKEDKPMGCIGWVVVIFLFFTFTSALMGDRKSGYNKASETLNKENIYSLSKDNIAKHDWASAYNNLSKISNYKDVSSLIKTVEYNYLPILAFKSFENNDYKKSLVQYEKAKILGVNSVDEKIAEIKKKLSEQEKNKLQKINKLKSQMRTSTDKVEGIKWYNDKSTPEIGTFVAVYMGEKPNNRWLRFKVSYQSDDWIFFDTLVFNIDGERIEKNLGLFTVERDNGYREVYESIDLPYNEYKEIVEKIIHSKNAILRLQGKYHKDITFIPAKKQAMKRVVDLYEMLKE